MENTHHTEMTSHTLERTTINGRRGQEKNELMALNVDKRAASSSPKSTAVSNGLHLQRARFGSRAAQMRKTGALAVPWMTSRIGTRSCVWIRRVACVWRDALEECRVPWIGERTRCHRTPPPAGPGSMRHAHQQATPEEEELCSGVPVCANC